MFSDYVEKDYSILDEEKHLISGPIMIPNFPIYRKKGDKEFYVVYEEATIREMAEKMLAQHTFNSIDIQHSDVLVDGVNLVELFIKDSTKGISPVYSDVPDGSLIATYKVHNPEIWEKCKSGEIKGFSLSGQFTIEYKDDELEELMMLVHKIKNIR